MHLNAKHLCMALCGLFLAALSACSTIPGSYAYNANGQSYFHGEFEDIRIPVAMNNCSETTIVTTPNNVKTGVQVFKGRVEMSSLIRAMHSYMHNDGWALRASTRSGKSLLIYEKLDRFCTIYLIDGTIFTEMQLFVVPKLPDTQPSGRQPTPTAPAGQDQGSSGPASSFDSQTLNE